MRKGIIMELECPNCCEVWEFIEDKDTIVLDPWPHYRCPNCGT